MGLRNLVCSGCDKLFTWESTSQSILCLDCQPNESPRPSLYRAVQTVRANISGHSLNIWTLREAEEVVLEELKRLTNENDELTRKSND
jgi:hypothetical protein